MMLTFENVLEKTRRQTHGGLMLNHASRKCAGSCKRVRSLGQFDGEDVMCRQCRRRAGANTKAAVTPADEVEVVA